MIKRISSVAVIIAMLFSMMCSFSIYAENDLMQMELTSAPTTVGRGDTVTITAAIKNYTSADTLAVFVDYDSDVLTFTAAATGLDVCYEFNPAKVMGKATGLYAAWVDTGNFKPVDPEGNPVNDFTLWTLTFTVANDAPIGETTLTYSFDEAQCNVWSDEANDSVSLVAGTDYVKDATITLNIAECVHDYTDAEYTRPAEGTAKDEAQHSITCNKCDTPAYEKCSFDNSVYTPASCTAPGYTTYTCSICGYVVVEIDANAPALEHDYQAVYTEPTFDADGYTTYTCSKCKDTYVVTNQNTQKKAVAKVGEQRYESLEEAIAAAEDGNTVVLLANTAVSESIVIEKDITLDLGGKTLSATEALNTEPVIRVLADVTVTNGTVDGINGDSYAVIVGSTTTEGTLNIADGTYKGSVSAISITKGTANISGGEFMVEDDDVYGTTYLLNCIDAAYKDGTAKYNITGGKFHGFNPYDNAAEGANTNYLPKNLHGTDSGNGVFEIGAHNFVAKDGKDATCTEDGYTDYEYCEACDTEKGKEVITAQGHKYESVVTEPTCDEQGYTTHTCSVCNHSYVDSYVDATNEHSFVYTHKEVEGAHKHTITCKTCDYNAEETCTFDSKETAPTCTEDGYTTYICSGCDFEYTETDEGSKLGHDYKHDEGTVGADATMSCTRCESDNVPCEFGAGVKTPATCEKAGTITYTCQKTNYSYTVDDPEAPVLGHDYKHDEGTVGANATMSCTRCDSDNVPCDFDAGVKSPATCEKAGTITYTCQKTNYSYTVDDPEAPALGHKYIYTHKGEVEGVHMHTITCENCDLSKEEACILGDWTVTEEPTKDKTGTKERSCKKCDYTETAVIAKLAYFVATADPEAAAGDEWTVEVVVKNNPGLSGVDLQVAFDGSVMNLIDAEANDAVNGGMQVGNHINGVTTIALITDPAFEGEETLVTLTFKIADEVEDGAYTVKIFTEDATDGAKPMPNQITIEEAEVTVNLSDFVWGDVTGNGVCNVDDALYLLRYLAGLMRLDEMEKPQAANTTNDAEGVVNVDDALLVLRFLAGLYNPENPST